MVRLQSCRPRTGGPVAISNTEYMYVTSPEVGGIYVMSAIMSYWLMIGIRVLPKLVTNKLSYKLKEIGLGLMRHKVLEAFFFLKYKHSLPIHSVRNSL